MKRLCIAALMFIVPLVYGQSLENEDEKLLDTTDELIGNITELNVLLDEIYQNSLSLASSALDIKEEMTTTALTIAEELEEFDVQKALELYQALLGEDPTEE